jgi:hypothetical protein
MKFSDIKMKPMSHKKDGIQAMIDFDSYQLSIVRHEGSYGSEQGLYEIGVFKAKDGVPTGMTELPGITSPGDQVKGFLSEEAVEGIIRKMESITRVHPKQI